MGERSSYHFLEVHYLPSPKVYKDAMYCLYHRSKGIFLCSTLLSGGFFFMKNVEQRTYYSRRINHSAPTSFHYLSVGTEYVEGVGHPIYYLNRSIQGAFPSEALSSSPRGADYLFEVHFMLEELVPSSKHLYNTEASPPFHYYRRALSSRLWWSSSSCIIYG